jgi:glc operon protein GlcG
MHSKIVLSYETARQIAETAAAEAIKNNWNVSIAIVNEACQLLYFLKMDDSTSGSGDIAIAKAKHAAYFRRDTKHHADLLAKGVMTVLALPNAVPIEGGVQLIYRSHVIGGIGVSGVAAQDDGKIAGAGADFLVNLQDH